MVFSVVVNSSWSHNKRVYVRVFPTKSMQEATILEIKATITWPFQSSWTTYVSRAMTTKKPAKKCAARSESLFLLIFLFPSSLWLR